MRNLIEDKDLLLKDLCARLPYGVKGQCEIDASYDTSFDTISQTHKFDAIVYGLKADLLFVTPLIEDKDEQEFANEEVSDGVDILDFKPYLFPLSSMMEEQAKELFDLFGINLLDSVGADYIKINEITGITFFLIQGFDVETHLDKLIDWLNQNHFDYRNLIGLGLAIDATGLNIY